MKKKIIIILSIFAFILIAGSTLSYIVYQKIFKTAISQQAPDYLYIPTGTTYEEMLKIIENENILNDFHLFKKVAKYKNLDKNVHAGRYKIEKDLSITSLINKLKTGRQEAVKLIFNNIKTKEQLSQRISEQLELDKNQLLKLLNDSVFLLQYEMNPTTILCMFIPNTYEFWWNTSATAFIERMYKEYKKFWNQNRRNRLDTIGLTDIEAIILASIVQEENHRKDEQARIAGLYMNRLKKGMLLQADPTVKYALGDLNVKRILFRDLEINSPYNTYKYLGLPPGPIRIPEPSAIEAVLYYEKHNYLYMCAKEDFSGYHNFAVSARQHAINASKYHQALNRKKIAR